MARPKNLLLSTHHLVARMFAFHGGLFDFRAASNIQ